VKKHYTVWIQFISSPTNIKPLFSVTVKFNITQPPVPPKNFLIVINAVYNKKIIMDIKLGILTGFGEAHQNYINSCAELGIDYEVVNILSTDWIELVKKSACNGFLARPPDKFQERNSVYMERLYFINKVLKKPIYPSYEELFLYENKRATAAWLEIAGYPHPRTRIFVRKEEALEYIKNAGLPLVFKSNIGAGSKGVDILRTKRKATQIINRIFGTEPLCAEGYHKRHFKCKPLRLPLFLASISGVGILQRHFVIIQEYLKLKWEWRIIKIDNSYFGYQKLLKGDFASGSHLFNSIKPPEKLLHLTREICEKGNFYSMAIDIFEITDGQFYINEMHSLFGSTNPSQMSIEGVPGRYTYKNNQFVFEEGIFNRYGSYLLRVEHFLKLLQENTP